MSDRNYLDPFGDPQGFLGAIVDSSDEAIIGMTLEGIVVTWNAGAKRLYGYTPKEVRGRSISLVVPADRRAELDEHLRRIARGERVASHETVRCTRDGRLVDVNLTMAPVLDKSGEIIGAATMAREITMRKHAVLAQHISEQRWRALIGAIVDGVVVIDAKGLIEAFNPAAERLFGYQEAEVLGRNVKILMPSPFHDEHDAYLGRYLATGRPRIIGSGREVVARRKDGTTFPIHLSVGEMHIAGERKFTGIIHDLSARVRMEEQLREQAAMVHLGEMAAVIAHEIKNPLAGMRGAIQVIASRMPEGRDASVMQEIVSRIDGLNELMKDLLLFSRPPQPHARVTDIGRLVTDTADLLIGDPEAAAMTIEVNGMVPPVSIDPDLMKIVFVNLLANASHAMNGRGTIRVSLATEDTWCQIGVADSGPGIPEAIRQQIFKPFFTTKSRGSGLGLPTVKRLVEAHGGRIAVDCPSTGGTTVTIQLPGMTYPTTVGRDS